jgi:hypothetical protein
MLPMHLIQYIIPFFIGYSIFIPVLVSIRKLAGFLPSSKIKIPLVHPDQLVITLINGVGLTAKPIPANQVV